MHTRVVAGNDLEEFLTKGGTEPENEKYFYFYVLYFWHLLDEGGLVQFTLAKLPNYIAANSESFNFVSFQKGTGSQQQQQQQILPHGKQHR